MDCFLGFVQHADFSFSSQLLAYSAAAAFALDFYPSPCVRLQVDREEIRTIITDTGSRDVVHKAIDVQAFVQHTFFESSGNVSEALVAACVEKHPQTLLGWFSYRANSPLRPSIREASLTSFPMLVCGTFLHKERHQKYSAWCFHAFFV